MSKDKTGWIKRVVQAWRRGERLTHKSGIQVYTDGRCIFSYGAHWPMAVRHGGRVFLNGDTFSNTTARHYSSMRSALSYGVGVEVSSAVCKQLYERGQEMAVIETLQSAGSPDWSNIHTKNPRGTKDFELWKAWFRLYAEQQGLVLDEAVWEKIDPILDAYTVINAV